MTDGLNVVSVRITNESTVVVWMIVRARTWLAVVFAASGYSRCMERINLGAAGNAKRYVNWRDIGAATSDPKVRFWSYAKARRIMAAC